MWPQRPLCGSPGMVGVTVVCGLSDPCVTVLGWWELLWCVASETLVRQSWDGGSYCGVWPQRPMCDSPGMVGVTVVCGLSDPCVTVLGWWELLWCVASDTHVRQSWDGGSYCGVWPQRPMCDSPGMVGVTVVCGLRDPCAAVLGWWELLWCVASDTHVRQSWDGGSYCGVWPQRPMCDSPGMVAVTVVCGLRDPCVTVAVMVAVTVVCGLRYPSVTVLGWWELLWCVASDTHV